MAASTRRLRPPRERSKRPAPKATHVAATLEEVVFAKLDAGDAVKAMRWLRQLTGKRPKDAASEK